MKEKGLIKGIFAISLILILFLTGCSMNQNSSAADEQVASKQTNIKPNEGQKINITINGTTLKAHLNKSSAAQAFAKELPIDMNFRNFMDMPEKVADLNHKLSTKGMPNGHTGTAGSIGYWSPDRRIVFYWGTEDYYEGIHILGKFDSDNYQKIIKNMGNNVTVKIEKAN